MTVISLDNLRNFWQRLRGHIYYACECNVPATSQQKDVSVPGFVLVNNARLVVKFLNTNVTQHPTLHINEINKTWTIYDTTGETTLGREQASTLSGYCEFIYDSGEDKWTLIENRVKNMIVYTEGEPPANPVPGMVWLMKKPDTSNASTSSEET